MEEINSFITWIGCLVTSGMVVTLGVIIYFCIRALIMYVRYKNVDKGVRAKHEIEKVKKHFTIFSYLLFTTVMLVAVNIGLEKYDDALNGEFKQVELAEESEKKSEINDEEQIDSEVTTELQTEVAQEPIPEPEIIPEPEPIPVVAPVPVPVSQPEPEPIPEPAPEPEVDYGVYVDDNGNGLIKGSSGGKYHVPGSEYYNRTTNPKAMFKSIKEAQAAGYEAPR